MNIYVLSLRVLLDNEGINYSYTNIFYSLEEAIKIGKSELYDICANYYDSDEVSKNKLYKFYNNKNLYYDFQISVVSGSRKRFNTSNEIMEYFNKYIDKIPNHKLYDFLLSLIEYDNRYYKYDGKLKGSEPISQRPKLEYAYGCRVYFSIESCKRRNWYIFEYTINKD